MRRNVRTRAWSVIVVPILVVAGACSGSVSIDTDATTVDQAPTETPSADTGDTGDAADEEVPGGPDEPDDGAVVPAGDWCELAGEVQDSFDDPSFNDFVDPVAAQQLYEKLESSLDAAVAVAPDEIRADVEVTVEAFGPLFEELARVEYDGFRVDPTVLEAVSDPELAAAADRIEAYNERECGIVPADDTPPGIDATPEPFDLGGGVDELDQILIEAFVEQGMTREEAECMVDFMGLDVAAGEAPDTGDIIGAFEECGIDLDRLEEIDG